jgi:uncharacterized protein
MSDTIQRRYLPRGGKPVTVHERADGAMPLITGYAAVFYRKDDPGTEFELYPGVRERIMPSAFTKAIQSNDVRALFNHDTAIVLGRSAAGTLRLFVDERGLRYEIDPPDTQAARDLVQSIRRGDITGSSFAFLPRATTWREDGPTTFLEREEVELFDVGPVTFPAYAGATTGVRHAGDLDSVRAEIAERRAKRDADRVAVELATLEMGLTMEE